MIATNVEVPYEDTWSTREESSIMEPYNYIASQPGKDMRGRFIDALNVWLQVPSEPLDIIREIVTMLHVSSLLIDDVEDNSDMRRGKPSAHIIFGIPQTINTANYVYFLAVEKAAALEPFCTNGQAVGVVVAELLSLHRGQGLDILWRDSNQCPSTKQYIDMVNKKTSGLLRIAARLMMACGTTNQQIDLISLVNAFGVFFQIRDDLMNLDSHEYTDTKGLAEDLSEGKYSFPIIHGIKAHPENKLLTHILIERPKTPTLKLEAIDYMRNKTRSFEYATLVLNSIESQIRKEIERYGGNTPLSVLVDLLTQKRK